MKIKLFLILFFLIAGFFFSFSKVSAQQGCCSWHWGVAYCDYSVGRYVCNDGEYSPTCTCGGGWSCTINGKTYYNKGEANFAWDSGIMNAVDRVYPVYLERQANEGDYRWWEEELAFNNCNARSYTDQDIIDNVKTGEEYFLLQILKSDIRLSYLDLLDRNPTSAEMSSWTKNRTDIEVVKSQIEQSEEHIKKKHPLYYYLNHYKWWILGILAVLLYIGIQYYYENRKPKKG